MPPLPRLTKILLLTCGALFLIESLLGNSLALDRWFGLWSLNSGHFMPWQLLSYGLLHNSISHLVFNMLALWMFGSELERLWGDRRYGQLLLAATFTAGLAQLGMGFLSPGASVTVGASGATYGLLLAYALTFPRKQFDLVGFLPMVLMILPGQLFYTLGLILFVVLFTNRAMVPIPPLPIPALQMVMVFGGLELLMGVMFSRSGIAHFAHLGGMLGAWLMLRYWRGQPPFSAKKRW